MVQKKGVSKLLRKEISEKATLRKKGMNKMSIDFFGGEVPSKKKKIKKL